MSEFVIHIGPHKTGSTYLQATLAALAPALRARGVLYPEDLGPKGHNLLPDLLSDPSARDEVAQKLHRYGQSGCAKVVLTAEDLCRLTQPQIAAFRDMLGGQTAQVVYYCRPWAAAAASHWNQNVRTGSPAKMPDQLRRQMEHPRRAATFNHGMKLEAWAQVFGRDALRLVALEPLAAAGTDSFAHFAATCLGLTDLPPPDHKVVRNVSIPLIEAEIIRSLNALWIERTGTRANTLAVRFLARRKKLDLSVLSEAATRCLDTMIFDEADPRLMALHRRLFRDYGDRLVAPHWPRLFFRPQARELPFVRPDYLDAPGAREALEVLYAGLA